MGAGKNTVMKLLVDVLLPTSGYAMLDNEMLSKKINYLKSVLEYLPQSFGLYDKSIVWQFFDYRAALKGIKNTKEDITKVLKEINLEEKKAKIYFYNQI